VAIELAQAFEQRRMGHEVAMGKAAALYDAFFVEGHVPAELYQLYWALDEAEYASEQDGPEDNAPEERSRKAVQAVLAKFAAK
jgi:hypothetical protein